VRLFYNGVFTDVSTGGSGEATHMRADLISGGIAHETFTTYSASTWESFRNNVGTIIIPELENGYA
jgi:hypothetical protein